MALVKTVEMRILADAGNAQEKLDSLAAEANKLDGNDIHMRFRVDSANAKAQLDEMRARATEAGFRDVTIKLKVDGAGRAIADLRAVKHEEDEVRGRGIMNRIGGLVGGAGGGIPGTAGIPFAGGLPLPALAAAVPLIGALATELVGVASGFAAAGAGAGAFAVLALPAVKKVETAYQSLGKAQAALRQAQAKEAADPTKAHANAVSAAALNLKLVQDQIAKMPASEQAAITGARGLASEFGKMSRAFEPAAFKVFADGLRVIRNLLPSIVPFATTFASAVDGMLKKLGKLTELPKHVDPGVWKRLNPFEKGQMDLGGTGPIQKFLDQLHKLEGPALNSIGQGIGKVAGAFAHLMTIMSGKDVAHAINIAFGGIAGTINVAASGIHRFMQNWDGMSAAAARVGHAVVGAFKTIGQGAVSFQNTVDHAFTAVIHGAAQMVSGVVHAVSGLAGKIKGAFAGAAGWLVGAGEDIIRGLINGIQSMIGAAVSAAEHVGSAVVGAVKSFLHIGSPSRVMHVIGEQTVQGLTDGIRSKVPELKAHLQDIAKMIKTELTFARDVARSTLSGLNLTSIDLSQGTVATGMQSYLASIRAFTADLRKLSAQHLNKNLLRQLIAAGPVTGDQYAQSILTGGGTAGSGVAQVNALYRQIQQESARLGTQAAKSVYGKDNLNVNVSVRLVTGGKQAFALEIVKVLKEYKRHGGGAALGIA